MHLPMYASVALHSQGESVFVFEAPPPTSLATSSAGMQCVAVCCSVLRYVALRCRAPSSLVRPECWGVLQRVAACCRASPFLMHRPLPRSRPAARVCSELQCFAVCCSVSQYVAVCCSVLQCVAVCCSVLQSVLILKAPPPILLETSSAGM